jgi:hypothetical protein
VLLSLAFKGVLEDQLYLVQQKIVFLLSHSEFRSNVQQAHPRSAHCQNENQNRKLDLESLGRLFQNQLKDWGLVGDRYPPGPLEG